MYVRRAFLNFPQPNVGLLILFCGFGSIGFYCGRIDMPFSCLQLECILFPAVIDVQ